MKITGGVAISGGVKIIPTPPPLIATLLHTVSGVNTRDYFGYSVGISGNRAFVGAYRYPNLGGSGQAYIIDVDTGNILHTINNPNGYGSTSNDYFGFSVAIDGNVAVAGAYAEDDSTASAAGKAYIFDVSTGDESHQLDSQYNVVTSSDYFGYAVSVSGNNVVVGAYNEPVFISGWGVKSAMGKVFIFNATTGNVIRTINNPYLSEETYQYFGKAVSIDGNNVIIGAPGKDVDSVSSAGVAFIFDASTGNLLQTLNNPNPSANDLFGEAVDICGNYAIVGVSRESDAGGTNSGKAYIFDVTTGDLLWTLDNPNVFGTSETDYFGNRVALSEKFAVVGAPSEDLGGNGSGIVYVYSLSSGELQLTVSNPNAFGTNDGDQFGWSVDIDGDNLIVGAYGEDVNGATSGSAYIFSIT
jgi:hypothetical protein